MAAKNATSLIPIVMSQASDPIDSGLVPSLTRPAGNVTGLSLVRRDLGGKRLELLKETVPKASRVAVLFNPDASGPALEFKEMPIISRALGVQLQPIEARRPNDFEPAFSAMVRERSNAVVVLNDPFLSSKPQKDFRACRQEPPSGDVRRAGVGPPWWLMSHGTKRTELSRRAATYVDKILKGTKPADLPIEEPTQMEFIINLKTAKQLGVTIAYTVLARVDEIIE